MTLDTPEKIKAFLLQNPKSTYINEYGKEYTLKNDELTIKSLPYNSWEYVDNIRDRMIKEANENTDYFDMECVWNRINDSDDYQLDRLDRSAETPLQDFIYTSEFEMYPKPEIIIFLYDCFNRYFYMKGEESLEDIFFGKSQKGIGNQAAKKSRLEAVKHLSMIIQMEKQGIGFNRSEIKRTDLELAEEVIEMMKLSIDPESLLRKYRRHIKGK
jgi:hypothetical protein